MKEGSRKEAKTQGGVFDEIKGEKVCRLPGRSNVNGDLQNDLDGTRILLMKKSK